jgi:hypothetical protein
VCAGALLAGCGGADGEETDAAHSRWAHRVDGACEKANAAIAERGWPRDLVDLDRLVVRGMPDAERALTTIERTPLPEGSEDRVRLFVDRVRELKRDLRELPAATGEMDGERLKDVVGRLEGKIQNASGEARRAGLVKCFRHGEQYYLGDSVRAAVFAQDLAELEQDVARRARRLDKRVSSPGELATLLDDLADTVELAGEGFDELDPPGWASVQANEYRASLGVLATASEEFAQAVRRGLDMAEAREFDRRWRRDLKATDKAYVKLVKALGTAPALTPGGGGESPTAPEEEAA